MTQTYCIKKMLGIEDPNIQLEEIPLEFKKSKEVNHMILQGKLTYTPHYCEKCGVVNHSHP